jgi:hypothetical protein
LDLGFGTTLLCPGGTNTIVWWEKYHRLVSIAQELAGLRSSKKKLGDLHEVFNGSSTAVQRKFNGSPIPSQDPGQEGGTQVHGHTWGFSVN